jgi:hypothetical protein
VQIVIQDDLNGITCVVGTDDGYNPDVMDDLQSRVIATYMQTLVRREVLEEQRLERELGGDDDGE